MKKLEKLKDLVLNEVEIYINENINEFEFIVDLNDINNWFFNENLLYISIDECCDIFIRDKDDLIIEKIYNDDYFLKKVKLDDCFLYIIM